MADIYFSDFFNVSPEAIDKYGAFNVSLINDLPVFIDPFLLFNSPSDEYQELHESLIDYMKFLKDVTLSEALRPGLIEAWFSFREVKQNWLGFSATGNSGRGLGGKFARALYSNFRSVFRDFGEETVTASSHIEKLCLIRSGVGRDMLSDFTTNLIKGYLAEFTQTFAREFLAPKQRRVFSVPKCDFNYETKSWAPRQFELPAFEDDFVLLTPVDMLTRDEAWINRSDLVSQFDRIAKAMPNEALRAQVDRYLFERLSALKDEPTARQRRNIYGDAIDRFPQVLDWYIREKERNGDRAAKISSERIDQTIALFINRVREVVESLLQPLGFYKLSENSFHEARERLLFLKDVVENKGGYRLFYIGGEPIRREEDLQIMFRLTWYASPSIVSREVNDGRGPVDFQIARSNKDKVLVEMKLASNTKLHRNLEKQCEVYAKASDPTHPSLKGILFFTAEEEERVGKVLHALNLENDDTVVLIDARSDNKPSGSKA